MSLDDPTPVNFLYTNMGRGHRLLRCWVIECLPSQGLGGLTDVLVLSPAFGAVLMSLSTWIAEKVTRFAPAHEYEVWHDRAVFHFLTGPEDRTVYRSAMQAGIA